MPAVGQGFDPARLPGRFENAQRVVQDAAVQIVLAGVAERSAHRKFDGGQAGKAHALLQRPDGIQHHGGDPGFFDFSGYETHGRVALRSDGHEDREIDLLVLHGFRDGLGARVA